MEKKLNIVQTVARELSEHSILSRDQIEGALSEVMQHLARRARSAIDIATEAEARELSYQYLAVCEAISYLGAQLMAYEDFCEEAVEREGPAN